MEPMNAPVPAAPRPPMVVSGLSPGDSEKIRTIAENDWTTAFIARDLDRVCGMCDPDIVYMPADHPALLGTSALREFLAAFPPVTSFTQPLEMIDGAGDLAVARARFTVSFDIDGQRVDNTGKALTSLRRDHRAGWRVTAVCWNFDQALGATPPPASVPTK